MILKANERGDAPQLATYLLSLRDNEFVELHEVRGFISDDLHEAFAEAEAIAKGTKCKKHLFSMSLNPPEGEVVDRKAFEQAIEAVERKLELVDHPRAIVFHEKEGRRHAHAVWSRIDSETMRAQNMAFYKQKLMDVSRDLYLEHGWDMPKGMIDRSMRNPLNFSRAEYEQAKRAKTDPRLIKAAIQECWKRSDSEASLKSALEEKGFFLAKGDRRAALAVGGNEYALSRAAGVKEKDIRARLPGADQLPSLDETRGAIASRMTEKLRSFLDEVDAGYRRLGPSIAFKKKQMVERQQEERTAEFRRIEERERREALQRTARLPKGFSGIWSRITGKLSRIKEQNEFEALGAWQRDRAEKDRIVARQLDERQRLQAAIRAMRETRARELAEINKEIAAYIAMKRRDVPSLDAYRKTGAAKETAKAQTRKRADGDRARIIRDDARQQAERIRERSRSRDRSRDRNGHDLER